MKTSKLILSAFAPAFLVACGTSPGEGGDAGEAEAPVDLKAPAGTYGLDKTHASLTWSIPHMGLSDYTARFADIDATVVLDPENLEGSSVELTVDPASVRTDYPGDFKAMHADSPFSSWDERIAKDEGMLNASDGNAITFKSTAVSQTGPRTADVTGDLTIRGQTKPVTMKATFNGELESHPFLKVPAIGFNAEGTIKPSDFGVNLMGGALGDEVTLRFTGEFLRQADSDGGEAPAE